MLELVFPSVRYKKSFLEAAAEFRANDRSMLDPDDGLLHANEKDFDTYVERKMANHEGRALPHDHVACTEYWLVDGDTFIGRASIRHTLNDHLRQIGGHIGYAIRPSKRKRGFGTHILALALPKARALGIRNVLLTCDETNVWSIKIIEKNGGVLENVVPQGKGKPNKRRYWIYLVRPDKKITS